MSQLATPEKPKSPQEQFEAKMTERLLANMGDCMPPELLKDVVARGVEEAFFKKRHVRRKNSHWDNELVEAPSWIATFLEKELATQVKEAVDRWIADNPKAIKDVIHGVLSQGLMTGVVQSFDRLMREPMDHLQNQLLELIVKIRNKENV